MRTSTLLLSIGLCATAGAQWSTDPANPLVVCNAANNQAGVRAISDGGSGWFVFWGDARANPAKAELYGQHIDIDGNALWAPDGLLIASHTDSIVTDVAPVRMADGTLLVGYIYRSGSGYDGRVNVIQLNASGSPLWAAPVELARSGAGPLGNIFSFAGLKGLLSGTTAFFAWSYVPQGSNDLYAYERVATNGDVQFGAPGHVVPNSGWGPFTIHSDLAGGLVFDWRQGNGSGAPLLAQRMDYNGDPVWTGNLQVSMNTPGLSYTYSTIGDGATGFISSWVMLGADLPMARYDTAGTFVWTPTPFYACNESHGQDNPVLVLNDGFLFVGWGDNRPPAEGQDLYVQKFDADGSPQWAADGVPVIEVQTYIPTPGLVPSNEGAVIATFNTSSGFLARRVLSTGALDWPGPVAFCTPAFNPFYEDQVKLPDGQGGVVAFWSDQSAVYGARIYQNGQLGDHTGMAENVANNTALRPYPSPTNGPLSAVLPDNSPLISIRAIDAQGRGIAINGTRNSDRLALDVTSLANGIYTLELVTDAGTRTGRFVIAK